MLWENDLMNFVSETADEKAIGGVKKTEKRKPLMDTTGYS